MACSTTTLPSNYMVRLMISLQKDAVCKDAAERYLAFVFLSQSGQKHNQLRADLKNQFMACHDNYPTTEQAMLRFLDNYDQQNTAAAPSLVEVTAAVFCWL
jgi:hypothetical protein